MTNPFQLPGTWMKAALHTHSTVSDGSLPPDQLVEAYVQAGFDVVAITDHWRLAQPASRDDVITIPAAELGFDLTNPRYPRQSAEFLVYGIDHIPEDPGGDPANWYFNSEDNYEVRTFPTLDDGCAWAAGQKAVVYVAHPYWNQMPISELVAMSGFAGIEIFNGSAEAECGRGDSSPWWDTLLGEGRQTFGIATDDQHYPLFELGLAWTMLRVIDRSPSGVVDALRAGAAYCSEGPMIHEIEEVTGGVEVACSGARSVRLQTEEEYGMSVSIGRSGRRQGRILATNDDGLITRAFVEGGNDRRFRRIVVVDSQGRRAWSNPI